MFARSPLLAAPLALLCLAGAAAAASTEWQEMGGGRARLVAVLDPATGAVSGMVEIALDDGWKTYWREPGASGIPPLFDFAASHQFVAGEPGFPLPRHIEMPDADFIGYRDRVAFTFEGMAEPADGNGVIRLDLMAGICRDICIPATAHFEIPFSRLFVSDIAAETAIEAARAALPGAPRADFRIEAARSVEGGIEVTVSLPDAQAPAQLFVEGLGAAAATAVRPLDETGKSRRFLIASDAGVAEGGLRLTLAQDGQGVEQHIAPSR